MRRGLGLRERIARLPGFRRSVEALPLELQRGRIYLLPTRLGLLVGGLLVAMLLGALNYNNNAGLLLAFLLLAVVLNSAVQAQLGLLGLRLVALDAAPVHAGDELPLRLSLHAASRLREGLRFELGAAQALPDPIAAETLGVVELRLPVPRRGRVDPGPLRISTTRPLGLFRAWAVWRPGATLLVYPALEVPAPPFPGGGGEGSRQARPRRQGMDLQHLRDYRPGDARRDIAWKASARRDGLLVRESERGTESDLEFDWSALAGWPVEARIARLARWVVEAERSRHRYRLRLPDRILGPARGPGHRHRCLEALALWPVEDSPP